MTYRYLDPSEPSIVGAVTEANLRAGIDDRDPAQSLGDLRAALALALRLLRIEDGRLVAGPSDTEIMMEVRRLRELADGDGPGHRGQRRRSRPGSAHTR